MGRIPKAALPQTEALELQTRIEKLRCLMKAQVSEEDWNAHSAPVRVPGMV